MTKKIIRVFKTIIIVCLILLLGFVAYIRFSRYTDQIIYKTNNLNYAEFKSNYNVEELFLSPEEGVKIHAALFKPDSIKPIATLFHFSGKGMHLMSSQKWYKKLLENGFQIVNYERRGFGLSNGEALSSIVLKEDALFVFDEFYKRDDVNKLPLIVWGQSLGGPFATMLNAERKNKVDALVLEGTFGSFPKIGKVYAKILHLENFKWVVPLLLNNDFPASENIKTINNPALIIHSVTDNEVPFELGLDIYENSDKSKTEFWKVKGKHIHAIYDYEDLYLEKLKKLIQAK